MASTGTTLPRVVGRAAAASVAAFVLTCGAAAAGPTPLEVQPAVGTPATTFVVSFTAPVRTGVVGSIRLRDELVAVSAAPGKTCIGQISAPVPDARRGQRVSVRLDPRLLGGSWCPDRYRGKLLELETGVCPHGSLCPTYVRLVATLARFTLVVRAAPPGSDLMPPSFAGLDRASACTPGPQRPGQTTPYMLSWPAAQDDRTPATEIVYDIYYATTPGGEDFSKPTWVSTPGVTSFRTPGLPSHGSAYFVVRARDTAGNEDRNTREQPGIDPCL